MYVHYLHTGLHIYPYTRVDALYGLPLLSVYDQPAFFLRLLPFRNWWSKIFYRLDGFPVTQLAVSKH